MSAAEGGPPTRPCPQCGKPASGNFCQHCGASMGGRFCTGCGAELTPGSRFCNQCGKPIGAPSGAAQPATPARASSGPPSGAHRAAAAATLGGGNLPWWIAGAAMFAMILVVGWFTVRKSPPTAQPAGGGAAQQAGNPAAGASAVDLSKMTPREAADRLFNHVMTDLSRGDTTDAEEFQPMAVSAYERAEPLDLDGLFHMSLLQRITDPTAALGTAERILQKNPDHLLGLGAAAEDAAALGKTDVAKKYYKHLLDVWDKQMASPLEEYGHHKPYLDGLKAEAQAYLVAH